jgi:hypothetical protein
MTRASDLAKLLGAGATINDGTTITTADNTNTLSLISTDADASTGPNLVLQRDSASPADNDLSGTIKFIADNDAAEATDCVSIFSKIIDASNGSEDASLLVNTIVGGSQISRFNITPTEISINDDSIDSDFRVESNGNENMLFVDGGNDKIGINTNAPNRMLGIENGDVQIHETGSSDPLLQLSVGNTQASPTQSYSLRIDNSDSDKFQLINGTSGGVALSVDTTGAITKPLQPAFSARPSSSQNDMAINTANTIVFGTEIYDQNSDFASNVFTAPVTGKYFLGFTTYLSNVDTGATYVQFSIVTSNRVYYSLYDPNFSADLLYLDVNIGVVADMDVGDTAKVLYHQGGGNAQSDLNTDTTFMGYLLG